MSRLEFSLPTYGTPAGRYVSGFSRGQREAMGALPFKFPKALDGSATEMELAYARGYLDGYQAELKACAEDQR